MSSLKVFFFKQSPTSKRALQIADENGQKMPLKSVSSENSTNRKKKKHSNGLQKSKLVGGGGFVAHFFIRNKDEMWKVTYLILSISILD